MSTYEVSCTWVQVAKFQVEAEDEHQAMAAVQWGAPGVRSLQDLGQDGDIGEVLSATKVDLDTATSQNADWQ